MKRLVVLLALLPVVAFGQSRPGPLTIGNNLAEIAKGGSGAQAAAQTNLGLTDGNGHLLLSLFPTIPASQVSGLGALATLGAGSGLTVSGNSLSANVQSVFGRAGAVSLQGSDVTGALGFTPYNAANPSGFITAAGAPVQSVFGRSGTVTLLSSDVTGALGFTPFSAAGGTLSGPLTAPGVNNTGSETVAGALTVGPGGSGTGDIFQSGTGNLRLTLGGASSVLNFRNSSGASLLQVGGASNSISPEQTVNLVCCSIWSGSAAQGNTSILLNQVYSGSVTGGTEIAPVLLQMSSDTVTSAAGIPVLYINHNFGGNTMTGGRFGADIQNVLVSTTGNSATSTSYTGLRVTQIGQANDNGTAATARGSLFGSNSVAHLTGSATYYAGLVGTEVDVSGEAGSSVLDKIGAQIVAVNGDAIQGARDDVSLSLNNQYAPSSSLGFKVGLEFGRYGGNFPVATNGTLIYGQGSLGSGFTVANGIDWHLGTFTSYALYLPSFTVDGSGNVAAASYKVGGAAGVSCSAGTVNLSTLTVTNGIVTHC